MNIENMNVPTIGGPKWKCDFCGAGLVVAEHPTKGTGYMPECNCMRPVLLGDFIHWLASKDVPEELKPMIEAFTRHIESIASKERKKL